MKKFVSFVLLSVLLTLGLFLPAAASPELPYFTDYAELLTDEEEAYLNSVLEEMSVRQGMDIVIHTTPTLPEGSTPTSYADDFFDYNGFGQGSERDGILFMLCVEPRKWAISTRGYGITAFTDAGCDYIFEQMREYLGEDDQYSAFLTFTEQCDRFIDKAHDGKPYDEGHLPKPPFWDSSILLLSLVVAFLIAFFIVRSMKAQLKTVRHAFSAHNYVQEGSLNLTKNSDIFLRRTVARRAKQKESSSGGGGGSSTHTSSSGATHGGSSGSY